MQYIVPNLWFDDQAEQAVERCLELFDEGSLGRLIVPSNAAG